MDKVCVGRCPKCGSENLDYDIQEIIREEWADMKR